MESKELEEAKMSDLYLKAEKFISNFAADEKCDEAHYKEAIALCNAVTIMIKADSIFSPNEDFSEIKPEHLK
ncbi:MAG: hypothetical protein P4L67_02540 [Candidatus Pacebacteria bacterium]|nr:hypothetical protein [Candidatus Paceibacterota bacterium]